MTFSEVVARVTELSAAINAYWDAELRKLHPRYPIVNPDIPDPPPPPQAEELRRFLRARPAGEVHKLLALSAAGEYLSAPEFIRRLGDYNTNPPDVNDGIEELVGMPALEEYLPEGVRRLTVAGIKLDAAEMSAVSA